MNFNYELKTIGYEAAFSYPPLKVVRRTNKTAKENEWATKRRGPPNTISEEGEVIVLSWSNREMSRSCYIVCHM